MIWLPFCTRRPGPDWKQGYPGIPRRSLDQIEGEAKHSAEGGRLAMHGVLDSERTASWTFSIFKTGAPEQHYPLESVPWTNGSPLANLKFIGEEHEGVAGEELNGNQILWTAQITGSVRELCPKIDQPPTLRLNLWEHNWLTIFGADPTACPSGRIPWAKVIAALQEDEMTPEQEKSLNTLIAQMEDLWPTAQKTQQLTDTLVAQMKDLWPTVQDLQKAVSLLSADAPKAEVDSVIAEIQERLKD